MIPESSDDSDDAWLAKHDARREQRLRALREQAVAMESSLRGRARRFWSTSPKAGSERSLVEIIDQHVQLLARVQAEVERARIEADGARVEAADRARREMITLRERVQLEQRRVATARAAVSDAIAAPAAARAPGGMIGAKRRTLEASLRQRSTTLAASDPISVIVPVYNQLEMTLDCLQSVVDSLDETLTVELIVIDDASPTEPVPATLAELPYLTVLCNDRNRGFLLSCNRASRLAVGNYLYFLNNDTLSSPGSIRHLVECAEARVDVAAVGSKLLFADRSLQEAGGIIWRDGSGWNYGRASNADDPRFNYVRDVDYCSGASLLVRRDVFERLGRFDERFAPAYFEDSDLCFAIRHHGMRVVYQPKSVVVHLEGVSSGTSTAAGVKRHQVLNAPKFIGKWRAALDEHYRPDTISGIRAARRLQPAKTLVMIDNYVPEYDKDSGSNKLFNFIRLFGELGYSVIYVPENYHRSEPYSTTFQNLGVEILYYYENGPSLEDALRERLAFADVVWMGRPYVASRFIPIVREFPNVPIVYDTHDLHYVRVKRELELKGEKSTEIWQRWERDRELELSIVRSVDLALTVTEEERRTLADEDVANVYVVPNVHDVYERVYDYEDTDGIMFIGGYSHEPNVDAVLWLCREIMPIVWETHPAMQVSIVGSNAPESVTKLASERVRVVGWVPDVRPYFEKARVFVAPLRYGAGLKGKVGQAFAYGVPTVTTSIGAEGFDLTDGRDALIADDAAGFAQAICAVYDDRARWSLFSASATRIVSRFSPAASRERLKEAIDLATARRSSIELARNEAATSEMLRWISPTGNTSNAAVFVDRDGVINRHIKDGYVCSVDDLKIASAVLSDLRRMTDAGYDVIVVTNQSCLGRGLLDIEGFTAIMEEMVRRMAAAGVRCRAWFCCPHRPDSDCGCRKPKPGMLLAASRALNVDLSRCAFIGDSPSDMEAARRAGVRGILVERNDSASVTGAVDGLLDGVLSC
jgi:histidinol-phosphate phosphatase family protein